MILPDAGILTANPENAKVKVDPLSIEGWMHPVELAWLSEQAAKMRTIVEVGCWKGRSTAALLNGGAEVWAVDHFQGSPAELAGGAHAEAKDGHLYEAFMANVGHYPNLRVLRMPSVKAAHHIWGVDMVFLDGDHEYNSMLADLKAWAPKANVLLCGHDRDWPGVEAALRDANIFWIDGPGVIWQALRW